MNLTLHVLKKDIRSVRILLGLWLLLVLAQLLMAPLIWNPGDETLGSAFDGLSIYLPLLRGLTVALLVARVIHNDAVVGTRQFWLTRPISRAQMLRAKALFGIILLVVPVFVEWALLIMVGGGMRELLLATPQVLIWRAAPLLLFAMFAALTQGFAQFALYTVGLFVVMFILTFVSIFSQMFTNPLPFVIIDYHHPNRGIIAVILMCVFYGGIIGMLYLSREILIGRLLAFVGIAIVFIIMTQSFSNRPNNAAEPMAPAAPEFPATRVTVKMTRNPETPDPGSALDASGVAPWSSLYLEPADVPPGYLVRLTDIGWASNNKTAPDDPTDETSPATDSYQINLDAGSPDIHLIPSRRTNNDGSHHRFLLSSGPEPHDTEVVATFSARKVEVVGETQFVKGAQINAGIDHSGIINPFSKQGYLHTVVSFYYPDFLMDMNRSRIRRQAAGTDTETYLLVNRNKHEGILFPQSQRNDLEIPSIGFGSNVIRHGSTDCTIQTLAPEAVSPLTREWVKEARLVRLHLGPAFTFTRHLKPEGITEDGFVPGRKMKLQ